MIRSVKQAKQIIATEEHEQTVFVTWLKKQGYWVSASANGGSRNIFEAMKLKRTGVAAGFPDVFVPLPTEQYHGFFIEMKRKKSGKISELQLGWLQYLRNKGYYAEVAYGAEQAKEMFNSYISPFLPAA
jgi:hypothetical protein